MKQEDFKDVTGEPYIYREEKETFLGKKYEYYISYGNDEVRTDQMRYEGYESPYAWVIQRLWETREKWDSIFLPGTPNNRAVSEKIDSKELWGAEAAWTYQIGEPSVENYCYELRYPKEAVILHTMGAECGSDSDCAGRAGIAIRRYGVIIRQSVMLKV